MSKSLPFYHDNRLGNLKMRGKREVVLPCGCCVADNKKKTPDRRKNFLVNRGLEKIYGE
jgi:hypothetical protein